MIDNYNDMPLGLFLRIDAILRERAGDEVGTQVGIIALLTGKTEDEVLNLPLADYSALAGKTAFLTNHCEPREIDTAAPGWNGLEPTLDFTKITTAQYIDFQTFAKDWPATSVELLSCFLIPEGKTYNNGYDIAEVQGRIREMPFPLALGYAAFFFGRFSASIADSLSYLGSVLKRTKNPAKRKALERKIREAEAALRSAGAGLLA